MTTPVNPKILRWTNPVQRKDNSPYSANDNLGYQIVFDGKTVARIPVKYGTEYDISQMPEYKALTSGNHTVSIQAVDANGLVSDAGNTVNFLIAFPPATITGVSLS